MKKQLKGQATEEQIQEWKRKYGDVYSIETGDSVCYVQKPDRSTMKAIAAVGMNDPIRSNEVMLENCWLGGDESIKTDDAKFFAVSPKLALLIEVKEAELKKL